MACEDFPCCGHESGCCPDFDSSGRQLNMRCICGAVVPLSSRSGLCPGCLNGPDEDGYQDDHYGFESPGASSDFEDGEEDFEDEDSDEGAFEGTAQDDHEPMGDGETPYGQDLDGYDDAGASNFDDAY